MFISVQCNFLKNEENIILENKADENIVTTKSIDVTLQNQRILIKRLGFIFNITFH